ncbi:MAG: Competence protein phosphoribosyltransferase domain protein [Labilithrix sp.]|nr:Competence protein phosphoribosyltransferase domain protein [Labilithrix sp.]
MWGKLALDLLGELAAPTRCAACDARVRPRDVFCASCAVAAEEASPQPEREAAVYAYGGSVAEAVQRFKFEGRYDLASRLGGVMAERVRPLAGLLDVVVPVPLHPVRLAERGYNQAALLGRVVARTLALRHDPRALVRRVATAQQASLGRKERLRNVASAFAARVPGALRGQRVLLVDDVRTTGATLAACRETLLGAGAEQVATVVLASTEGEG